MTLRAALLKKGYDLKVTGSISVLMLSSVCLLTPGMAVPLAQAVRDPDNHAGIEENVRARLADFDVTVVLLRNSPSGTHNFHFVRA
jgi:hypothetical protein